MLAQRNRLLLQKGPLALEISRALQISLEKFGEVYSGDLQGSPERPRVKSHDWIALKNTKERADLVERFLIRVSFWAFGPHQHIFDWT
jgi:hypothetical protein